MKQRAPGDSVDAYAWPVEQHGHTYATKQYGTRVTESLETVMETADPRWLPRETAVFRRATRRWCPVQGGVV